MIQVSRVWVGISMCPKLETLHQCSLLFQDFTYLTVEMYDDLDETLSTHYPKCETFIDEGRRNGVVLVHW